jgi:hypothetical protein
LLTHNLLGWFGDLVELKKKRAGSEISPHHQSSSELSDVEDQGLKIWVLKIRVEEV